jgi:hypothetical protein
MNGFIWALGIVYWLGLYIGNVWLCYTIAEQKNRNEVGWGWLAVFFGIPVTFIIAGIRPLKTSQIQRNFAKAAREREEMREETSEWKTHGVGFSHQKK